MPSLLAPLFVSCLLVGHSPAAAAVAMPDQFGVARPALQATGEPVVVLVVTARRLRTVRPWERALAERYEGLRTVIVADVPDDPPAEYERVAERLSARVPDGVSVLIDMERAWARELGLDTSRPNLLLLGGDGRLVASVAGRWSESADDPLFDAVDRLIGGP